MGLAAAWHLRRADPAARVTVLERERPGAAASGASAAGVRAMFRDPCERALALAALARWPGLDRELEGDVLARLALGRDPLSALWSGLAWRAPLHAGAAGAHQSTHP
jgi:glycine/D-amino acid oxidase-like deaminating enzyme